MVGLIVRVCPSICPSVRLSVRTSVRTSDRPLVRSSDRLSVHPSIKKKENDIILVRRKTSFSIPFENDIFEIVKHSDFKCDYKFMV